MVLGYDSNYVDISGSVYNNDNFIMIKMKREGNIIKAKCFLTKDENGNSVFKRFTEWSKNRNIILLTGAAYWTGNTYNDAVPFGLTIDNGELVNRNMPAKGLDGLVIVYATGGISCTKINDGNLIFKGACNPTNESMDLRNPWDLNEFINCAKEQKATVFQQHLLVYKDTLTISSNGSDVERSSRFLAVCRDENDQIVHAIIYLPSYNSLFDGVKKVYSFLKDYNKMKKILFMINSDTGSDNIFRVYDKAGKIRPEISGLVEPEKATSLLVYYY